MKKSVGKAANLKAPVSEMFFSYQGEGIFLGRPQVFVRFCGCNLRCNYCDTPENQSLNENQNYFAIDSIVRRVQEGAKKVRDADSQNCSVSLTGGEPLLYPGFLSRLLPQLKKSKMHVYLETNGTLPEAYAKVSPWVDTVSMDIKLPSACGAEYWKEHGKFLKLAGKKAFVKLVLTNHTTAAEVAKAVKLVSSVSRSIPFVFQPASPVQGCPPVEPRKIFQWIDLARKKLDHVQVTPQMHKIWNVQ